MVDDAKAMRTGEKNTNDRGCWNMRDEEATKANETRSAAGVDWTARELP